MNKIKEVAEKLREEIIKIPEVNEYFLLKEKIENDEELKSLKKEICRLEKVNKIEEKNNLLKIYNSHPLILNFEASKKEVIPLLEQIKQNII